MASESVEEWIERKLESGADREALKEVLEDKGYSPAKVDKVAKNIPGGKDKDSLNELRDSSVKGQSNDNNQDVQRPGREVSSQHSEEFGSSEIQTNSRGQIDNKDSDNSLKSDQERKVSTDSGNSFIAKKKSILIKLIIFLVSLLIGFIFAEIVLF